MTVTIKEIAIGDAYSVCEVLKDNKSYLREFYESLAQDARRNLAARIKWISENGPHKNKSKFTHEGEGIYAIEIIKHKIRVYCFFDSGKLIILTHGFIKGYQKARPEELERAKRLRAAYQGGGGQS